MKYFFILSLVTAMLAFSAFPHRLVGNWLSKGPNNSKVLLSFKGDGTFRVSVDGSVENEGRYTFNCDTFTMYDNNCGASQPGKYNIIFYTRDSARFALLADSCKDRAGEVDGGVITRVK